MASLAGRSFSRLVGRSIGRDNNVAGDVFGGDDGGGFGDGDGDGGDGDDIDGDADADGSGRSDGFDGSDGRLGDDQGAGGDGGGASRSYKQHAVYRSASQRIATDRNGSRRISATTKFDVPGG